MTPEDESDEEFLDDPIKLTDIESTAVENAQHEDISKTIDLTESDTEEIIPISKEALHKIVASNIPVTFFNISRNVRLLYKCLPLSIKIVDCDKYPRYYRNVRRSECAVNLTSAINKNNNETANTDTNIKSCTEEKTETDKMIVDEDKAKLKIRPVATPYQILKLAKTQETNISSKLTEVPSPKEQNVEENMRELLQNIDFKKNRGLIGLKITQINKISTSLSFQASNIKNNNDVSQTTVKESKEYVNNTKYSKLQDTITRIKEKVCNKTRKPTIGIKGVNAESSKQTTESMKQTTEEAPTVKSVFFTEDENQQKNILSKRRFGVPQENKIVTEIKCDTTIQKQLKLQDCDKWKKTVTVIEKGKNKPSMPKEKKERKKRRTVKDKAKNKVLSTSSLPKEMKVLHSQDLKLETDIKKPCKRTPKKKNVCENKSQRNTTSNLLNTKPTFTLGNLKQTNDKQKVPKQPKPKHFVNPKNVKLMANKTLVVNNEQNCESSKDALEKISLATKPDSEIPPRSHVMNANPAATVTEGQVNSNSITKLTTLPISLISIPSHESQNIESSVVSGEQYMTCNQLSGKPDIANNRNINIEQNIKNCMNNLPKVMSASLKTVPLCNISQPNKTILPSQPIYESNYMNNNKAFHNKNSNINSGILNNLEVLEKKSSATMSDPETKRTHVINAHPAAIVTQGQVSSNNIPKLATIPLAHSSIQPHVSESSVVGSEQHIMTCKQSSGKPDISNNQNNNGLNIKNNPTNVPKVMPASRRTSFPCNISQPNKPNLPSQLPHEDNNMAFHDNNSNVNCGIGNSLNNNLFFANMPQGIELRQHYNPRGFNATMPRPPNPYMHRLPPVYHNMYGPRHHTNNAIFNNRPTNSMFFEPNTNYEKHLPAFEVFNENTRYCTPNQNQIPTLLNKTIMRERKNNYPTLQKCLQDNISNLPAAQQRLNLNRVSTYEGIQQNLIQTQEHCQQLPTYNPMNPLVFPQPPAQRPPLLPPPPPYVAVSRHESFNQYKNSNIGSSSVPFNSYEGSTVIGQNMAGPIRKINIVAVPAATKDKGPPAAEETNIKIKLKNVNPINTKIEMLEELNNSTGCVSPLNNIVEENLKITPASKLLSPKSSQKRRSPGIVNNNVPPAQKTFCGPLSKKPKLDHVSTSPKSAVTGNGYSQPILPIPTYEETLEMLARKNYDVMTCVNAIAPPSAKSVDLNPKNTLCMRNNNDNNLSHKQDKAAKKISIDEYKKRVEIKQEVE